MSSDVEKFVSAILKPKLQRVDGVALESDAAFRNRIVSAVIDHTAAVEVATGEDLDAIGLLHGIIRIGLR